MSIFKHTLLKIFDIEYLHNSHKMIKPMNDIYYTRISNQNILILHLSVKSKHQNNITVLDQNILLLNDY